MSSYPRDWFKAGFYQLKTSFFFQLRTADMLHASAFYSPTHDDISDYNYLLHVTGYTLSCKQKNLREKIEMAYKQGVLYILYYLRNKDKQVYKY